MISLILYALTFLSGIGTGKLKLEEFQTLNVGLPTQKMGLQTGWYYIVEEDNGYKRQLGQTDTFYFVNPVPITNAKEIGSMKIYQGRSGLPGLAMWLNEKGSYSISEEELLKIKTILESEQK